MEGASMRLDIEHDKNNTRFISTIDDNIATLDYSLTSQKNILNYRRTYVPPELRDQGIGASIVKFALDYAKENNYKIIPTCSFVKKFIEDHPAYKSIIAS